MTDGTAAPLRSAFKNMGIVAVIALLALVLLLATCRADDAHPSDDAIIGEFAERRADYETLRDMILAEEEVNRIAPGFVGMAGNLDLSDAERAQHLPDDRLARYRALFNELDLESGIVRHDDDSVEFLRSTRGIATSGSAKRILYSPGTVPPLLGQADGDTDEQECPDGSPCTSFRQLAPEWYLAFDSD